MKLENISDKSLFRILKVLYDSLDNLDDFYESKYYYSGNKTQEKIEEVLKNLGVENDFLHTQFIYLCLEKNWHLLEKDILSGTLIRPKKREFLVEVSQKVYKTCYEKYQHKIESYDTFNNINLQFRCMVDDELIYVTDGEYLDDDCETDEISDSEITDITEVE